MKKLNFMAGSIGTVLTREQMKKVIGGSSCSATCPAGQSASITDCNGTCTGSTGSATCSGPTATLTKNCKVDPI